VQHAESLPHVASGFFVVVGVWEVVATSTWGLCNLNSLYNSTQKSYNNNNTTKKYWEYLELVTWRERGQRVKGTKICKATEAVGNGNMQSNWWNCHIKENDTNIEIFQTALSRKVWIFLVKWKIMIQHLAW